MSFFLSISSFRGKRNTSTDLYIQVTSTLDLYLFLVREEHRFQAIGMRSDHHKYIYEFSIVSIGRAYYPNSILTLEILPVCN